MLASPVYFASANGTLISFLDRLFYNVKVDCRMKVGASIAVARRGGASSTFDELNKYFLKNNMVVPGSAYWNSVHGHKQGEAVNDSEGLQVVDILAKNMTFLMRSIALGKEQFGLFEYPKELKTNFIR